jgi:hypothetical protein
MSIGSWLAYGEILRNSAIGAARSSLRATQHPRVVSIASTKGEIEITGPGATIEIMGQGLPTGITVRGLTTVQGLTIMMRSKGLEEHHERGQAGHDGHEGDDVNRLLTRRGHAFFRQARIWLIRSAAGTASPHLICLVASASFRRLISASQSAHWTGRWKLDGYALRNSGYGWRNSCGPRNRTEAAPVLLAAVSAFRASMMGGLRKSQGRVEKMEQ